MMPIEIEDVEKVATLAKLEFPSEEKQKLAKELEQIVTYVARLNELDTKAVEPTLHITDLKNVLREDNVQDWLDQEQALANAPQKKQGYFSVPKVIG
ncbi:MAG: Asp-tRNA(Asn)/Glu-tRNA(Gln) amidotransferase subunit GatC [Caldithrix sp.]|nr:MAG: Asp-tRNA(Asn)/Glu-tRNA(Gln) amidotransferase subunit GatC [Caldithrix sp.]TDI88392.1 MAG: Asp-tRNA(Asn)/Glu-tRNA(Gln) amidotransferase subunit GatC [Caldithrix sp.]TDI97799.1 MAG: Asp-tRNA(Asn)/Glu-tRNA(Gln) amidotransferase subunit GatC [Caldithrix sp.]